MLATARDGVLTCVHKALSKYKVQTAISLQFSSDVVTSVAPLYMISETTARGQLQETKKLNKGFYKRRVGTSLATML